MQWLSQNRQMRGAQQILKNEANVLYVAKTKDAAQYSSSWAVGEFLRCHQKLAIYLA